MFTSYGSSTVMSFTFTNLIDASPDFFFFFIQYSPTSPVSDVTVTFTFVAFSSVPTVVLTLPNSDTSSIATVEYLLFAITNMLLMFLLSSIYAVYVFVLSSYLSYSMSFTNIVFIVTSLNTLFIVTVYVLSVPLCPSQRAATVKSSLSPAQKN